MSYDDIENATPDIVIGSTIEEEEDDYQYENESDNEVQQEKDLDDSQLKGKKSVAFAGLDEEDDEKAEERAKREFEEGGGLPEQPTNPDISELTPLSPEIINRQADRKSVV